MSLPLNRRSFGAKPTPSAAVVATSDTLLTPVEVAQRLRVTPKALEHWRRRGDGPRFVRLSRSRVRYRVEEVEDFLAGRTRRSTAEG